MKEIYGIDLRVLASVMAGFFVGILIHQKIVVKSLLEEKTVEISQSVLQSSEAVLALILIIVAAWVISSLKGE